MQAPPNFNVCTILAKTHHFKESQKKYKKGIPDTCVAMECNQINKHIRHRQAGGKALRAFHE